MKPIAPLMIEHRLIEKMIELLKEELSAIEADVEPDYELLTDAVDFLRTYADRTHHGKEEDILFKRLEPKKTLDEENRKIMEELLLEHRLARANVKDLVEAIEKKDVEGIKTALIIITDLYPKHIEKEDQHFFQPIMNYFTDIEQKDLTNDFNDFDRQMIHEKYGKIVEKYLK